MGYTEGEWSVTDTEFNNNIGNYRMVVSGRDLICHLWPDSNPDTEANARLIAAAPEMYEALVSTINADDYIPSYMAETINKAIAKAEGKL